MNLLRPYSRFSSGAPKPDPHMPLHFVGNVLAAGADKCLSRMAPPPQPPQYWGMYARMPSIAPHVDEVAQL